MIWDDGSRIAHDAPGPLGWIRLLWRGGAMGLLVFGGLGVLLVVRTIERPLCGVRRPVTPSITVFVCRTALRILGLHYVRSGDPLRAGGAVVANHASWLDIFVLNAGKRIYFVSKSEVAGWPGIGWLARATGTVFIERTRTRAREQTSLIEERLLAGHRLLFFPEGTSTDGLRILPFKTTLFASFFSQNLRRRAVVQPVTVRYHAPVGADPRFYGWWGEMTFGGHLLRMLSAPRHGRVEVIYHRPLAAADFDSRKTLARACEAAIRSGYDRPAPGDTPGQG